MLKPRAIRVKEHASMPDNITIVTSSATTTGSFSAFMLPSNSSPTVSSFVVGGTDISSNISIFPEDSIIPCNVTSVTISAGNVILFN